MSKRKTRKKKSPVYLGKETYGTMPREETFKQALKPYFEKKKEQLIS